MRVIWNSVDAVKWFWSENHSHIGAALWSFVFAFIGTEIILIYGSFKR